MRLRHPPPLRPGARVAVACPASPVEQIRIRRGIDRLGSLGLEVVAGDSCWVDQGLWAGADRARAEELIGFLLDPSIDAIFAGRGGVGCMRILPYLELLPNDAEAKWIVGRSDLTAIHLSLWRRGWVGLSGPMAATDFGGDEPPPTEVIDETLRLLRHAQIASPLPADRMDAWREGEAEGWLAPANLSILSAMVGTPYLPSLRGAILVLEEVDEPPRRIDRMLTQLRLAGLLDGIAGLVLGQFTRCGGEKPADADLLRRLLRDHAEGVDAPVLAGFPYGHEAAFQPLPIGVPARVACDPPRLELMGDPHGGTEEGSA